MVNLDALERSHRINLKISPHPVTLKEGIISFLVVFLCAPFLTATFLMIPMIGQMLIFFAAALSATYLYIRRSLLLTLIVSAAYLSFLTPLLIFIQVLKHRLDVTLFFLIASGIPVSIFFIGLVAGKLWWEVERRESVAIKN